MKLHWTEISFVIFSMGWAAYVFISYQLTVMNDCSYIQTDACRTYMRYAPGLVLWRGAAVELLALVLLLWLRRR